MQIFFRLQSEIRSLIRSHQQLECSEECSQLERNRRLALALQIENPDQAQKLSAPKYSDFMMEFAKKDLAFASKIHNKLSELVKLAKEVCEM